MENLFLTRRNLLDCIAVQYQCWSSSGRNHIDLLRNQGINEIHLQSQPPCGDRVSQLTERKEVSLLLISLSVKLDWFNRCIQLNAFVFKIKKYKTTVWAKLTDEKLKCFETDSQLDCIQLVASLRYVAEGAKFPWLSKDNLRSHILSEKSDRATHPST